MCDIDHSNYDNNMDDDPSVTVTGPRNYGNGARSISVRDQGRGSPYSREEKATSTIGPSL